MIITDVQIGSLMEAFKREGATPAVAKRAARSLGISETLAVQTARAFEEAYSKAIRSLASSRKLPPEVAAEVTRGQQRRESAQRLIDRADAAESKGLSKATTQELEAVAALTFGL